jgi:predicted peptidase
MKTSRLLLILFLFLVSCNKKKEMTDTTNKSVDPYENYHSADWDVARIDSLLVKHTYQASNELNMPYRLFSPRNSVVEKIPLLIFLHGRGDRGTDNTIEIYKGAKIITRPNSILYPEMQEQYPCYVLVPQCSDKTKNEEWAKWEGNTPETPFKGLGQDGSYSMSENPSESGQAALELIDKVIRENEIDPDRVYLIGLSMGGFGTWEFTSRRPDLFAAAVPMAGFSDPNQVEKISHIPFWIFHGESDESNPVEGSRNMYKLLLEAGANVKYTEYEGTGHGDSFRMAFEEPELLDWLFTKTKSTSSEVD